jgi:acetylornithine deacetylase
MTVTQINAGKQHNVVPSECDLVIDIALMIAIPTLKFFRVVKEQVAVCASMHT